MMQAVEVRSASQVAEARRVAVALAKGHGFDEADAGRVAIVVTELATNLLKHGEGGVLLVGGFADGPAGGGAGGAAGGIECLALDQGPGMADVAASVRDGHSTAGTPGNGLGAVLRGAQATDIYSAPGRGTAILARLLPGRHGVGTAGPSSGAPALPSPRFGAVNVPMAGEEHCGDSWCHEERGDGWSVMVADGLGHGQFAAEASHRAATIFSDSGRTVPSELLADMHGALRPTRGAAISIARVDPARGEVVFAGVGNVAGVLVGPGDDMRRMVCHNGTIGHIAKHMRDFTYPVGTARLLVLASDGLGTTWRMDRYPGLLDHHPTLIAGVLYRDFTRGRDDVTVLVARLAAQWGAV